MTYWTELVTSSPHLVIFPAALAICLLIADLSARLVSRYRSRHRSRRPGFFDDVPGEQQLTYIARCGFEALPLVDAEDARVLDIIHTFLAENHPSLRVLANVSLADAVAPVASTALRNDIAFARRSLRDKRIDFAVLDKDRKVCLALGFSGTGRFARTDTARSAIQREAIRKAGITYVEMQRGCSTRVVNQTLSDVFGTRDPAVNTGGAPKLKVVSA